jgi:hypothetical protein
LKVAVPVTVLPLFGSNVMVKAFALLVLPDLHATKIAIDAKVRISNFFIVFIFIKVNDKKTFLL